MNPRGRRALLLAATFVASACKLEPPFERTHPFDPGAKVTRTIVGIDSTHSQGQRFYMSLVGDPPMPDGLYIGWRTGDPVRITGGAGGDYVVLNATAQFVPVMLRAELDRIVVSKEIMVGQRAATLDLSCGAGPVFDPCDDAPFPPGSVVSVYLTMVDSNTNVLKLRQYAVIRAQLTSRDPSVVTPQAVTLDAAGIVRATAVGPGSTWLVVRVDEATDSIRISVAP